MIKTDIKNIPQELQELNNWVLWTLEYKDNKEKKVPRNSAGYATDATKIENCTSYDNAVNIIENTDKFNGIGFSIQRKDKLVFIDLDNCVHPEYGVADWALKWVEYYDSYTEISQSGNGLHIIVKCDIEPFDGKNIGNYEIYNNKHYFALTGNILEENKFIKKVGEDVILDFMSEMERVKEKVESSIIEDVECDITPILEKLNSNKQFVDLFTGGITNGYKSDSEADHHMCCLIAEYTRDANIIFEIVKKSNLWREKWERNDYSNSTIKKALENTILKVDDDVDLWETHKNVHKKGIKPVEWVINGIIPKGLTIICGDPKIGKSFMVLDIALSVASGKNIFGCIEVEKKGVAYLALEDDDDRINRRIDKLGYKDVLDNLYFAYDWKPIGDGCVRDIEYQIKRHPEVKLIIIDTLVRIQSSKGVSNQYKADSDTITKLHKITKKLDISIILVHHNRKSGAFDGKNTFERISGTNGIMGSVDAPIILQETSKNNYTLEIKGREVEKTEIALEFNNCRWKIVDDFKPKEIVTQYDPIINILKSENRAFSNTEIFELLGDSISYNIKQLNSLLNKLIKRKNTRVYKDGERALYIYK